MGNGLPKYGRLKVFASVSKYLDERRQDRRMLGERRFADVHETGGIPDNTAPDFLRGIAGQGAGIAGCRPSLSRRRAP